MFNSPKHWSNQRLQRQKACALYRYILCMGYLSGLEVSRRTTSPSVQGPYNFPTELLRSIPRINVFPKAVGIYKRNAINCLVRMWQVCGVTLFLSSPWGQSTKIAWRGLIRQRWAVTWTTSCLYTTGHAVGWVKRICSVVRYLKAMGAPCLPVLQNVKFLFRVRLSVFKALKVMGLKWYTTLHRVLYIEAGSSQCVCFIGKDNDKRPPWIMRHRWGGGGGYSDGF